MPAQRLRPLRDLWPRPAPGAHALPARSCAYGHIASWPRRPPRLGTSLSWTFGGEVVARPLCRFGANFAGRGPLWPPGSATARARRVAIAVCVPGPIRPRAASAGGRRGHRQHAGPDGARASFRPGSRMASRWRLQALGVPRYRCVALQQRARQAPIPESPLSGEVSSAARTSAPFHDPYTSVCVRRHGLCVPVFRAGLGHTPLYAVGAAPASHRADVHDAPHRTLVPMRRRRLPQ